MSGGLSRLADALASEQQPQDTYGTATYLRTDSDGTAWVMLAGSDMETPANGGTTVDAREGDIVTVRQDGTRLYIMGNGTAPSVGHRQVAQMLLPVEEAVGGMVGSVGKALADSAAAQKVADAVAAIAEATAQHFWTDNSGVHVTQVTQEQWEDSEGEGYHSGPNVLINSLGQLFRDGLNNLLTLTTEGNARALTVWDGLGNAASNVRAIIGEVITLGNAADGSVVTIDSDSMDMMHGATEMLHFGYGEGASASGTANAPYYTIGTRASNSTVGNYSVAEGYSTTASGYASHAEGVDTTASGYASHAEGWETAASSYQSHAEGVNTEASGGQSHAEGAYTVASGYASHAEGSGDQTYKVVASGDGSHAEGDATYGDVTASARAAHAEGSATTASGEVSHAEGTQTTASGNNSHAEGQATTASGSNSHAQNHGTIAASYNQTALGRYNVADANSTYAVIVGNGASASARSNALSVSWDGLVNTRSGSHSGDERPSSVAPIHGISSYDSNGDNIGYTQIAVGSNRIYRSFVVTNISTSKSAGIYVNNYDDGSTTLSGSSGLTLARDATTVTLSNSAATTNQCWRNMALATVTLGALHLTSALSSGSNRTVGTVPSGYRPVGDVTAVCGTNGDASTGKVFVIIGSSGTITLYNRTGASLGTGVNVYLTATYAI